jgi:acetyl esterase/lipase
VSAGFDPLRDEAAQYVEKLKEAGVSHEHLFYDDLVHAFLFMEDMLKEECANLYSAVGRFLLHT